MLTDAVHIIAPFVQYLPEIGGQWAFEVELLARAGVNKAQGTGMQCLPRQELEAILDKLPVSGKNRPFDNTISPIGVIAKKRVPDVLHMHPDLMGPSCFETAFDEGDVSQALHHLEMGDCLLSMLPFWISIHLLPEALVPSYMGHDSAVVFLEISPYQGKISPPDSMVEKLPGQVIHGLFRLAHLAVLSSLLQQVFDAVLDYSSAIRAV